MFISIRFLIHFNYCTWFFKRVPNLTCFEGNLNLQVLHNISFRWVFMWESHFNRHRENDSSPFDLCELRHSCKTHPFPTAHHNLARLYHLNKIICKTSFWSGLRAQTPTFYHEHLPHFIPYESTMSTTWHPIYFPATGEDNFHHSDVWRDSRHSEPTMKPTTSSVQYHPPISTSDPYLLMRCGSKVSEQGSGGMDLWSLLLKMTHLHSAASWHCSKCIITLRTHNKLTVLLG